MTLINDITSIDAFIAQKFPSAHMFKQTAPLKPDANTFVTQLQNDRRTTETNVSWRTEREYQIVYFGASAQDVLAKMDELSSAIYSVKVIDKIYADSFAYGMPFKSAEGVYASVGILTAITREMKSMAAYENADKIMHVNIRI
ncbi:hypothetical protein LOZ80_14930 [Paenibacillus sp. HWE-109]|uniref:hypothetical protein n=1 Tax=Paenibacillus sp. HWE-109 TaxID=1306526 RepID=UPI001EDF643E|nr:hypothetical protein [Paenibacillus sp. HWE-109]UKS30155.1 hypothetical protein LOZ80_14930 [Paenibacillus sp. HWE-109]